MWSPPNTPAERRSGAGADVEGGREGAAEEVRRVWLWVHPAAAKEALREIWKACSLEGAPWAGNIEVRVRAHKHKAEDTRCFLFLVCLIPVSERQAACILVCIVFGASGMGVINLSTVRNQFVLLRKDHINSDQDPS